MCAASFASTTLIGYFRPQFDPRTAAGDVVPLQPRRRNRSVDDDDWVEQIDVLDRLPDRQPEPLVERVFDGAVERLECCVDRSHQAIRAADRGRDLVEPWRIRNRIDDDR